ncbi:MAG: helix-turn-helix transcriptional regulator [Defluviitaleaceae bacterium]|nr:helix-turn-helix transcriptional regulator [Defluviitaleaceae bacterium]
MRINSEIVKRLRKRAGLSQEKLAEKLGINQQQISLIENGKNDMDVWQFIFFLEILGQPSENFWQIYLDTKEYDEYRIYRKLNRMLRDNKIDDIAEILPEFENGQLAKRSYIKQFAAYLRVITNSNISPEQKLDELYKVIEISIKDFRETEISTYRLNYNEICIINEIAINLFEIGEKERAIDLLKGIIASRKEIQASEEDMGILFPPLMATLSTFLGRAGRIRESLKICNEALDISREYNNARCVPSILYNIASGEDLLGVDKNKVKERLLEAYYCANALGRYVTASVIKKDAEESFGITIP